MPLCVTSLFVPDASCFCKQEHVQCCHPAPSDVCMTLHQAVEEHFMSTWKRNNGDSFLTLIIWILHRWDHQTETVSIIIVKGWGWGVGGCTCIIILIKEISSALFILSSKVRFWKEVTVNKGLKSSFSLLPKRSSHHRAQRAHAVSIYSHTHSNR